MPNNYHCIAERFADAFSRGVAPWTRSQRMGRLCDLPYNAATGNDYENVNTWLLELVAIERGYFSAAWGTRKDWNRLGARVPRTARPTQAILYFVQESKNRIRFINVYNEEEVSLNGFVPRTRRPVDPDTWYDAVPVHIRHGGLRCFYRPKRDRIIMAHEEYCASRDMYLSIRNHEWSHAILMHPDRLHVRRSQAAHELMADLSAAYITSRMGVVFTNRIIINPWVQSWVDALRIDFLYLWDACFRASEAYHYAASRLPGHLQ